MRSSQIDVDAIHRALGHTRYFHTTQYILICASVFIVSTNSFFYIFFTLTPEFKCNNLTEFQLNQYNLSINEVNLIYDKCSIDIINTDGKNTAENRTLDCVNGYYYTTPVDKSIVSQWNLVCNSVGLAESTQMFYTLGQVVSGLVAPCFIEKFGRKPLRVSSHILMLVFNLIAAYSKSYWLFTTMRFLTGTVREANILSSVCLVCELYPKERRIFMSGTFIFIWALSGSSLGFIAYMLKDYGWNTLILFNAVISGYFLLDYFFLEESLRWLFANSKIKTAKKLIKKAAKQNKVNFDNVWSITLKHTTNEQADNQVDETSPECRSSESRAPIHKTAAGDTQPHSEKETSMFVKLFPFFKSPYLRRVTIVVCIEWAVNTASWVSMMLMLEVLVGSIYLNYTVMSLFDIVSVSFYTAIAKRFGHKISLLFWKTLAAVSVISVSMIKIFAENSETMERVILVLYFLAIAGLSASSSGDFIYIPELYPTQIRSVGNGIATTFMRIVCMASPFLKLLAFAVPWAPGIIIGTGCIVSSVLLQVILPETGRLALPQTIEDINMKEKKNKSNNI